MNITSELLMQIFQAYAQFVVLGVEGRAIGQEFVELPNVGYCFLLMHGSSKLPMIRHAAG
jgi:hypothetical protein